MSSWIAGEVVRGEAALPLEQVDDPLRPVRFGPLAADRVRIPGRHGLVVGRDDEVLRRIEDVRQCLERNPAGPLGRAGPAVGGRGRRRPRGSGCAPARSSRCGRPRRRRRNSATGTTKSRSAAVNSSQLRASFRLEERDDVVSSSSSAVQRKRERLERRRAAVPREDAALLALMASEMSGPWRVTRTSSTNGLRALDRDGLRDDRAAAPARRGTRRACPSGRGARDTDPATSAATLVSPQAMNRLRPMRDGRRAGQRGADDVEVAGGHVREIPERRNAACPDADRWRAAACRCAVSVPSTTQLFEPSASAGAAEQEVADGGMPADERTPRARSCSGPVARRQA